MHRGLRVAEEQQQDALAKAELVDLQLSLRRPRTLFNFLLTGLVTLVTLFALVPLVSVLYMLGARGGRSLNWEAFTSLPPAALQSGGGFANALVGTLVMV